jgi:hypothetical protein
MAAGDSFLNLINFTKGKVRPNELINSDPLITDVKVNKENLGQSLVELSYVTTEDFLRGFGFSDDDSWFYGRVTNPHYDYDFWSSDAMYDDFLQGYSMNFFDDSNKELIKKISNLISKNEIDFDDNDSVGKFWEVLSELFPREHSQITNDLAWERNRGMTESARNTVENDLKDWAKNHDLKLNSNENGVWTTVADLISNFIKYNIPHENIKKLIELMAEENDHVFNWSEDIYEYEDINYFDEESFNRSAGGELENILSKIEDTKESEGVNMKEFLDMVKRIREKFTVNTRYKLPKKNNVEFAVTGFDINTGKINVKIFLLQGQRANKVKVISLSEENFYNLLYQPTLFDLEDM